ncbi:Uncharacterised protein [Acinetobacter baumannii]|nr:Uncharacterised protein [Acinetobacter baumannii]
MFFLQLQHQIDDLRAHRHVQRGQRLIGDDHLRLQDQRAGQRDALFLPGSQHVRIVVGVIRQHADLAQRLVDTLLAFGGLKIGVQPQRRIQQLADALARVERGARILKNHANTLAAVTIIAERQRMIVDQQLAGGGFHHAGEHLRQRGFAGAVLADHRQRLAFAQGKADRFHRLDVLAAEQPGAVAVGFAQVAHFQQRFHVIAPPCSAGSGRRRSGF